MNRLGVTVNGLDTRFTTALGTAECPVPTEPDPSSFTPDISNLAQCIEDSKRAALDSDQGPENPTDYYKLRGRLEAVRQKLPPLYQENVVNPFLTSLDQLGAEKFNQVLLNDPDRTGEAGLLFDIAQAILQQGEGYLESATDAFQEVVSDLYDGFLSAEDRRGVKPPDHEIIPPLVKWGNPDFGPYTWPVDATSTFGCTAGVVNLPPANAKRGLLAWAALGHEVGGHDVLHADEGLLQELSRNVRDALRKQNMGHGLPEYWASRIDETASDVCGILNMGPAAGIGLIGYFRGLNSAYAGQAKLRNNGPANDPHPADILRGYLAAAVVSLLEFEGAAAWAKIIEAETDKDLTTIRLGRQTISRDEAVQSARIVASAIAQSKLTSLEHNSLSDIQNWRNQDEIIVQKLRTALTTAGSVSVDPSASGIYATHVVAAAVVEGLSKEANIPVIFDRMVAILKSMHKSNPSWGPLYVSYPGNLAPHRAYYNYNLM